MDFAVKGGLGGGDSIAALALVRALLDRLASDGVLSDDALRDIIADALNQVPTTNVDHFEEARRLLSALRK